MRVSYTDLPSHLCSGSGTNVRLCDPMEQITSHPPGIFVLCVSNLYVLKPKLFDVSFSHFKSGSLQSPEKIPIVIPLSYVVGNKGFYIILVCKILISFGSLELIVFVLRCSFVHNKPFKSDSQRLAFYIPMLGPVFTVVWLGFVVALLTT